MVEARGLRKIYKNGAKELEVLKGIDLKAEKGEVLAVLGPSGAGKSTLLHLLGGLDSPTSGEVLINGVDIYSLGDMERARMRNRKIGFVFQFYHLLPEFDALENVLMPLLIKGENGKDRRDRGVELLSSVGLEGRMSHKPGQLSGGEQQRVAIARALVNEPELLLCDEPTGNLDSETGKNIIALLWELNKRRKMTLIIVTHDAQIAKDAKRVLHIRDGKINQ
ncbi:MAG: ABC transporter ATP-binding protein [Omnitrophica WOR_2 bacterium RIFCSPLOWO2_12_FULL_51_24]|nr:MAG: ABC transporter ATP-binding protein [Omnitrophica WOR_2 bacterium RIFCSPHIGHO2_01_FULL_49_10]OGX32733.1 MAG: ABC transporter ATP-binding protein [Omnitrophica WOR_2 bacterium RIFCSPLOWO2_02_FULL_50_19]OGX41562.1 MAG: ABC transporter ATP-binding protein [Omnitrophica WOR_2 bacterium RIFCSPLOWO2_12_FULL_51_24]